MQYRKRNFDYKLTLNKPNFIEDNFIQKTVFTHKYKHDIYIITFI